MHTANTSATIPFIPVLKSGSSLLSFSGSYVDICEMLYLTEQMHRHVMHSHYSVDLTRACPSNKDAAEDVDELLTVVSSTGL